MPHRTPLERDRNRSALRPAFRLAFAVGLAALLIVLLSWGLRGLSRAHAATIRYVDRITGSDHDTCDNPAMPCATIGYALKQAAEGDAIHIADEVYPETLDVSRSVAIKGGFVRGTFQPNGGTAYIAALGADAPVIRIHGGAHVRLEKLQLQGADHTSGGGGGILIEHATAVISSTQIAGNSALEGGGILVVGRDSELVLRYSTLFWNVATDGSGGGLCSRDALSVTLDHVKVQNNHAVQRGGGVYAKNARIYDSLIEKNSVKGPGAVFGGGLSASGDGGRWHVEACTVVNNQAAGGDGTGGGMHLERTDATIVDSVIRSNAADNHAGVSLYHTNLAMTNCLIAGNQGDGLGGDPITGTLVHATVADNAGWGVRAGGTMRMTNSIIWGHDEGKTYECVGDCTLTYSNVEHRDPTGVGNLSQDPRFVNAGGSNYRLRLGSPCVDAGTPASATTHDLDGTPRDNLPDLGAYELTGVSHVYLPLSLKGSAP